ncbi:hypothetical protein [Alteromonas sp. 14N.309.X.WAT.G.H12]|uniref:hypothetical protein n=1 Tax=Alteromonas sp. 14N.309.X.WAT.G.H12 TaxID=3120824 RepID=UPI002FD1A0D5
MSSGSASPSSQTDLFTATGSADEKPIYTEICNALYERELAYLSQFGPDLATQLKRRIGALPHRIQRAAHYLAHHTTPLNVDSHNGSWQYKQPARCPGTKIHSENIHNWLNKHAAYGLPIPIYVQHYDEEHIELDSIDRVITENKTLHTNKYGWFSYDGLCLENPSNSEPRILKPTKSIMASACCGHRWNHKGKQTPRTLTLRELLLSTTINWKNFSQ